MRRQEKVGRRQLGMPKNQFLLRGLFLKSLYLFSRKQLIINSLAVSLLDTLYFLLLNL